MNLNIQKIIDSSKVQGTLLQILLFTLALATLAPLWVMAVTSLISGAGEL